MPNYDSEGLSIYHNFTRIEKLKEKISNIDYVIINLKKQRADYEKELDEQIKKTIRETYNWS